jgi:hypothetical protein
MVGSDPGRRRAAFLGAGAVAATGYVTLFRLGATWGQLRMSAAGRCRMTS